MTATSAIPNSDPIHPGEHLAEILSELGITQYRLAKTIGVPPIRIHDIVHCRRSITADTALRIGKALGTTPDFWLNLQRMYDLEVARATTDISAIEQLVVGSLRDLARQPPEERHRVLRNAAVAVDTDETDAWDAVPSEASD